MRQQLPFMKLYVKGENSLQESKINKLVKLSKENDANATEELLTMFKSKVTAICREYFLIGAEFDDLIQEGMIGLYKAISVYDDTKNHNFSAFASLCIHRQLQNAVKNANRKKNNPLNSYVPIKYYDGTRDTDEDGVTNLVIVDDTSNIEQNYIDNELKAIVVSKVKNMLTEQQFNILKLFLNGESYITIAKTFDLTTKQVDNMLQAIKKKLKTIQGEV